MDDNLKKPKNKIDVMSVFDDIEKDTSIETEDEGKHNNDEVDELLNDLQSKLRPSLDKKKSPLAEEVPKENDAPNVPKNAEATETPETPEIPEIPTDGDSSWPSWSFSKLNSIISHASQAVKQAEEKVREIPQVQMAEELSKDAFTNSFTLSSLWSSVIDVVAPPISSHEVLRISIYHDIIGSSNLENVIYTVFDKVMSQVDGGELIVKRGKDSHLKLPEPINEIRDISLVEGRHNAIKLAKANAAAGVTSIRTDSKPSSASSSHNEMQNKDQMFQYCNIVLAIQAYTEQTPWKPDSTDLAFFVYLEDVEHGISFGTNSQSFPIEWYEWQKDEKLNEAMTGSSIRPIDWVPEWLEEGIALSVGVLAQRYVTHRKGVSRHNEEHFSSENTS